MKLTAQVEKDTNGRLTFMKILRSGSKKPVSIEFTYDEHGTIKEVEFTGRKADIPDMKQAIELVNEKFLERIGTIGTIDLIKEVTVANYKPTATLDPFCFTERWIDFVRPNLYRGRTGPFFLSEGVGPVKFSDWTLPLFYENANTLAEKSQFMRALRVRNEKPGVPGVIDEFYLGLNKAMPRCEFGFEANLTETSIKNGWYIGVETNSGGGIQNLHCLCTVDGAWYLRSIGIDGVKFTAVDLDNPDVYARYKLIYEPPYLYLHQAPAADPGGFPVWTESLDLGANQGLSIPFVANEVTTDICEFGFGEYWVNEIETRPIQFEQTNVDPGDNPSMIVNVAGRQNVWVFARSNAVGKTLVVAFGRFTDNMRDFEELTTATINTKHQVWKAYSNGCQYCRITLEETGTLTNYLGIYASAN